MNNCSAAKFVETNVVLTNSPRLIKIAPMEKSLEADRGGAIPFDSLPQKVFLHLWKTYDILRGIEGECLANFGVSAQQYNVLRILKASHPEAVPTMELSRLMISKAPDITRMLDRLESRILVNRTRPRDNRRVVEVAITTSGLNLLSEMHEAIVRMNQRQVGHLKKNEMDGLIELLKTLREPHEGAGEGWLS